MSISQVAIGYCRVSIWRTICRHFTHITIGVHQKKKNIGGSSLRYFFLKMYPPPPPAISKCPVPNIYVCKVYHSLKVDYRRMVKQIGFHVLSNCCIHVALARYGYHSMSGLIKYVCRCLTCGFLICI